MPQVINHKLIVNRKEAKRLRAIFALYLKYQGLIPVVQCSPASALSRPRIGNSFPSSVSAYLLVGSGGVLRHGRAGVAARVFAGSVGEVEGGWQLPRRAEVTVDVRYVLAAAGLLATRHPDTARRLLAGLIPNPAPTARRSPSPR